MRSLPTGVVTLLFTDIEGSTTLLERHPAAYREALKTHHRLLSEAVEGHDGVVFERLGDGVYAAFPRTTDAVAAALQAQLSLHEHAIHLRQREIEHDHVGIRWSAGCDGGLAVGCLCHHVFLVAQGLEMTLRISPSASTTRTRGDGPATDMARHRNPPRNRERAPSRQAIGDVARDFDPMRALLALQGGTKVSALRRSA